MNPPPIFGTLLTPFAVTDGLLVIDLPGRTGPTINRGIE